MRENPSPLVAIVVLNFKGDDCLLDCLESLALLTYSNKEIIVIDNGSFDNAFLLAREKFPNFTYIQLPQNKGFAGGMNMGIEEALKRSADWIWLMNNDARVSPDSLTRLIEPLTHEEDGRIGALSPVIKEESSKKVWFQKGRINFFRMRAKHTEATEEEKNAPMYTSEFLTGCALLICRKAIEDIGKLDESFFLYYEDADFSLRLHQRGWKTCVVPQSVVYHSEHSVTNPEKTYHLVLSGLIFFHKHASILYRLYFYLYVTIREIKNRLDIWRGRAEAQGVRRAYEKFYHDQ